MTASKSEIIALLQKDILKLQGFKGVSCNSSIDIGLGSISHAFPNNTFPVGAIHEFIATGAEDTAATGGFIGGLLAGLMKQKGIALWISASRNIFPPALKALGIPPEHIIFIDLKREKEILWVMEEALKYDGLSAVVGEMQELDFTASRRLQLAVEKSRVTGFILRRNPRHINTTACVARWKITSLPGEEFTDMPGVGFPKWNIELLKIRNGRPGKWDVSFVAGKFRPATQQPAIVLFPKKKAV